MAKSTKSIQSRNPVRPEKPYEGFPLFAHQTGRWAKKVRQKILFFGRWGTNTKGEIVPVDDLEASATAALAEFNRQWPYISQGRTAPPIDVGAGCTIRDLCNAFLTTKQTPEHDHCAAGTDDHNSTYRFTRLQHSHGAGARVGNAARCAQCTQCNRWCVRVARRGCRRQSCFACAIGEGAARRRNQRRRERAVRSAASAAATERGERVPRGGDGARTGNTVAHKQHAQQSSRAAVAHTRNTSHTHTPHT